MERIVVRYTERTALYLEQCASIDMERASNTVSPLMTLTTRETHHTARTSTLQTFRAPTVGRPSDLGRCPGPTRTFIVHAADDTGDTPYRPNV
jgi:hypothetical protein